LPGGAALAGRAAAISRTGCHGILAPGILGPGVRAPVAGRFVGMTHGLHLLVEGARIVYQPCDGTFQTCLEV